MGVETGETTPEIRMRFLTKLKLVIPFDAAIPHLGVFPEYTVASYPSDIGAPMI